MVSSSPSTRRSPGRPTASTNDRRQLILSTAGELFAELGYERATIRAIAERAGVDPKLVMHYFGTKQQLFVSTVRPPDEVGMVFGMLATVPRELWGERITDVLWQARSGTMWQTLTGVVRAAASEPKAAAMFRDFYVSNLVLPNLSNLDLDHREARAVMMSTLMVGWVFAESIVGITDAVPVADAERKKLFAALVQQVFTAEI